MNVHPASDPLRAPSLGLGLMGMSELYGPADDAESVTTIQAALDHGVRLFETGDAYGMGHGELLLRDALRGRRRESALISIRFGALREPGGGWTGSDSRPVAVKNALAYSLRRLGTDYIDVYRPGRPDPEVPIEETIGALGELVKAGYIRGIGLSEVGADTLRRAHAVHPVTDVQIEYSLFSRGIEQEILLTARELGITVTAYGPLSRGLLSGHWSETRQRQLPPEDFRTALPRFQGANLTHNLALVEALRRAATTYGVTVAQLAIAWVAAQGPDVIPLVGARTRRQLAEALGATAIDLDPGALTAAEQAVPLGAAAGERYMAPLLSLLDSERPDNSGDRAPVPLHNPSHTA
ncbi:Predicted oxidoreductase [Streptosporangium subroseum]|uniref:Predicted oxidoreductase n=1 Tax=Streptosporangium subroseum TaxID=106412 RepID=A0A239F268_9ACTN|nr:aldo/keto reductase [Streptosporangium subroseum]SNS50989.1 Predicted oxidoreductase [Streptosporangium subroseum]